MKLSQKKLRTAFYNMEDMPINPVIQHARDCDECNRVLVDVLNGDEADDGIEFNLHCKGEEYITGASDLKTFAWQVFHRVEMGNECFIDIQWNGELIGCGEYICINGGLSAIKEQGATIGLGDRINALAPQGEA